MGTTPVVFIMVKKSPNSPRLRAPCSVSMTA
jgi:hypothetical protein